MTQVECLLVGGNNGDSFASPNLIEESGITPPVRAHGEILHNSSGIELEDRKSIPVSRIYNVRFHRCHFGPSILSRGLFSNCNFSESSFDDARLEGVEFRDCVFDRCNFQHSVLVWSGIWKRATKFTDCSFLGSDLRSVSTPCAEFSGCTFDNCNLTETNFDGAVFSDCTFKGLLEDTEFHGSGYLGRLIGRAAMTNCDFRLACLRQVNFFHINVHPSWLPEDDNLLVLPRGGADLMEWKVSMHGSLNHPDIYIDHAAPLRGAPAIAYKDVLIDIYGLEKVQMLEEIIRKPSSKSAT